MSNNILVPLDGSPLADAAVPHAVELAKRTGAALRVVRVHAPMAPVTVEATPLVFPDPRVEAEVLMTKRAWLDSRAREIRAQTGLLVQPEFRIGMPGEEIVAAASECDAKFIVCTTHGAGGWAPHWFGSVTDYVIRHTLKPVLAMSSSAAERSTRPATMLVLLDGSELSHAILHDAQAFAKAFGTSIELFRVVVPPWVGDSEVVLSPEIDRFGIDAYAEEAKRELDAVATDLRAMGLTVRTMVEVNNSPTRRILDHIEKANPDLVALATHGRGLARLLVGSVADKVLRAGARPMLCVRPQRTAAVEAIRHFESELAGAGSAAPA
jgi:nucleotide-binding universal stress UspA family protein